MANTFYLRSNLGAEGAEFTYPLAVEMLTKALEQYELRVEEENAATLPFGAKLSHIISDSSGVCGKLGEYKDGFELTLLHLKFLPEDPLIKLKNPKPQDIASALSSEMFKDRGLYLDPADV
jgi:hypothetical protein